MKVENFLEKHEIREVNLVKKLVLSGGEVSHNDMVDYLDVSRASLDKDLASLAYRLEPFKESVRVDFDGSMIMLFMSNEFSLAQIYQVYLKESVKVKIISYLYRHQEFSIVQLTQKLMISESSLFRKIKELNDYLKEFHIKIRNGRLQGEELQIRYFYYQFYWYVSDKPTSAAKKNDDQVAKLLQATINFMGIDLEPEGKERLKVWLYISKNRVNSKKKVYKELRRLMEPYMEDHFYQKMRSMVLRYFSRYSIEVDEEEAMLHFVFMLAFPVLTEHDFHEYTLLRARRAPIATIDTYVVETIIIHYNYRRLPYMLEREMFYYLSQIHAKMYFLKGAMEVYEYDTILSKEKQFTGKDLVSFAEQLRMISMGKFEIEESTEDSLLKMELLKYISLLAIVTFSMTKIKKVGIDLKMETIYTEALNHLLILNMRHINGIQVEKYQPKKAYDLVLTNAPVRDSSPYGKAEIYVLSEILSPFDMKNIQNIIQNLTL